MTVANGIYGTPGGVPVYFSVVLNYAPADFTSRLAPDVASQPTVQPYNTTGCFPTYNTTMQNGVPFALNALQVNLLDVLYCWAIETSAGGVLKDFIARNTR